MVELKYEPVSHDHKAFLKNAQKREGFSKAYNNLEEEYTFVREMLAARSKSGLTQEAVAELMGTTKSAVSRLESAGKHALPDDSEKYGILSEDFYEALTTGKLERYDEYDESRNDFSRWKGIYETWQRRKQAYREDLRKRDVTDTLRVQPVY